MIITATTLANLGDFNVYAKGIHPSGTMYDSFMVGDNDSKMPAVAKKTAVSGTPPKHSSTSGIQRCVDRIYHPASVYVCNQFTFRRQKSHIQLSQPLACPVQRLCGALFEG